MNLGEPSVQSIDMGNSWEGGVMAEADLTHEQLERRTLFQLHLEWRSHGRRLGRCHGTVGGLRSASLPCVDEMRPEGRLRWNGSGKLGKGHDGERAMACLHDGERLGPRTSACACTRRDAASG